MVTDEQDDPHVVLGLQRGATSEQVRQAYFRMVRVHTPEAHPEEFKRVRVAYEALRSQRQRTELALLVFDESVTEVDLDLVARVVGGDPDLAAITLAAELSASDFACAEFPADLTPVHEEDLFDA